MKRLGLPRILRLILLRTDQPRLHDKYRLQTLLLYCRHITVKAKPSLAQFLARFRTFFLALGQIQFQKSWRKKWTCAKACFVDDGKHKLSNCFNLSQKRRHSCSMQCEPGSEIGIGISYPDVKFHSIIHFCRYLTAREIKIFA